MGGQVIFTGLPARLQPDTGFNPLSIIGAWHRECGRLQHRLVFAAATGVAAVVVTGLAPGGVADTAVAAVMLVGSSR